MTARLAWMSVIVVGLALASTDVRGAEKAPAKPGQEEIDKLIEQLKSDKFKVREEATRRLMERDDALSALQEAAKSENAEVAGRARKAIEAINKRMAKRALRRAAAMLKKGQTDQFVEVVVRWREYVDEDCWKAAVEHVEAIAEEASKVSGGQFKLTRKAPKKRNAVLPWVDVTKLEFVSCVDRKAVPGFIKSERIMAEKIMSETSIQYSFLICTGAVQETCIFAGCVLFANGNLKIGTEKGQWAKCGSITDSIVVSDGDVTVMPWGVQNSVILARGDVRLGPVNENSVIISGGTVQINMDLHVKDPVKKCVIREHQSDPLDLIRFFDPTQVGIAVKSTTEGVLVEALAAAKSFAQAGIRKGDRLIAVDGVKVDSAEAFRRLLRRQMQKSKTIVLELRREDKPLRIEVPGVGVTP